MAKLITLAGSGPVDEGERVVVSFLEEHLPGTYTLIPNVEIIQRGQPVFEYDLIVIAPHALYVIEIKRWRGGIQGDDYTWLVAGHHRRQNPWTSTNNKARVLKSAIAQRQPSCASLWVEALVAIADEHGILNVQGQSRNRIFRYTDLPAFLTNPGALGHATDNLRPLRGFIETAVQEAAQGRQRGPLIFGDYEVLETLSHREDVTEYLARNNLLRGGEAVRLRVFSYNPYMRPEELALRQEIIRREAEALQRIGPHPNLITLRGFFTAPADPNLFVEVTDWSEEGTLRNMMNEQVPVSLERKLEIAYGIAEGLRAAHDASVVHRDVRPENVLIGREGKPRLMSFDRARLALPTAGTVGPLRSDPDVPRAYMAPELLNGSDQATPAADLYSLGVILFELLVGEPLYDSPEDALRGNTSAGGPQAFGITDMPVRLNNLVKALTHPTPEQRPQTAQEVLVELHAILSQPSHTERGPAPEEPEPGRQPGSISEQEIAPHAVEPAIFEVGSIVDGKYQVQRVLNEGGSGRVYMVYDEIFDRVHALKVFNSTSLSLDFLKKEVQAIKDLDHPNIVRVNSWGKLAQSARLYLLAEFVDGEDLTRFTHPDQHLPPGQAVDAILDLLSALEALHPDMERLQELRDLKDSGEMTYEQMQEMVSLPNKGWLHRDIKPANLMLTRQGLKLVDFNIASKASEAGHTYVGTRGYMLPDVGIMEWNTDGDLFATGIVLYELVTGHHPYPNREPNADDAPTDPRQYVPDLSPALSQIMLKAISCDPSVRYHSARPFRQDLLSLNGEYVTPTQTAASSAPEPEPGEVAGEPVRNPYVDLFLTLYSQARTDNSGTRGLPEVARLTYVETRLDRELRPSILEGKYRLVIITGNAGDGKTAFIQSLEQQVAEEGGTVERVTDNSTRFMYNGVRFHTNYDGSQDEGAERANDLVLNEFFAQFSDEPFDATRPGSALDTSTGSQPSVHLIAINEGRLIDFFGHTGDSNSTNPTVDGSSAQGRSFKKLGEAVLRFFDPFETQGKSALPDWLLIVDLNQRSVVARDPEAGNTSIFERQMLALLKPEFWTACQGCPLSDRCFIKYNVDSLSDPASGPPVRERIRTLLETVHLRRQLHITMRDLRSAISWMLLRDHTCENVAELLEQQDPAGNGHDIDNPATTQVEAGTDGMQAANSARLLDLFYYNAFASRVRLPEGRSDDRLVRMLRQIDPAEVANPSTDTLLHSLGPRGLTMLSFEGRTPLLDEWLSAWRLPQGWKAAQQPQIVWQHREYHALLRRVAYYERRDDTWLSMLPYEHLSDFRKYTQSEHPDYGALKRTLAEGISLAEGARNSELAGRYICLRAGDTSKVTIKSFRLFPVDDFKVWVPRDGGRFLEYTPDRIVLYHDPRDARQRLRGARRAELVVSLDVLELLSQIQRGFTPSLDDVRGFFVNLIIFKNALTHLPYRQVVLTRDDDHFYELSMRDHGVVELGPWYAEKELEKGMANP